MSRVKVVYGDLKINIKELNNKWWLDFYYNKKRVRKSTHLSANRDNLNKIKKTIIPEIVSALTGSKTVEFFEKDLTLDEFSIKFFNVYKDTVREHVYKASYRHYKNKVKPIFGKTLLKDITPLQLEEWQNSLLKKHAQGSVIKYRSVLNSILDKALTNELIKINPFSRIKTPSKVKKKFKKLSESEDENVNPFNTNEIKKILDNATGNLYYVIFFMLHTGIRPGELISLTWDDIDFVKKRIAVDKNTFQGKVGDVKTQSSVRYIDLLPQLEKKLKELRIETGNYPTIFISHFKKPFYSHDILNKRFRDLLSNINIKERSIYNLRHTFASHMISNIQNGVDILWVSKTLGHKDVSITLKIYAKYIIEDEEKRLKKINLMSRVLNY